MIADLYAERLIKSLGQANANQKILELTNEALDFGLPFASQWEQVLDDFVRARDLQLGAAHFLGSNNKAGPYAVVVEMIC